MTENQKMNELIQTKLPELNDKKVLIFGDVGIDEYVLGEVDRISPEAPVPVVDVKSVSKKLGLAANVAANVKSLGGDPLLVSVVGDDKEGEGLRQIMAEKQISANNLVTDPHRPTTAKTRVMSGQHHIVRVDYESRTEVDEKISQSLEKKVDELLGQCDGVILQDYAKGMINQKTSQMVIQKAKAAGKVVLVDPYRSSPLENYQGADFMTPNRDEAFELARQIPGLKDWQDVDVVGAALMEKIQSPKMVITLGAKGMKIFNGEKSLEIPTFARKVFDVTGAGDTVISAFAIAVAAGWSLEMSGYFANLAAGVVVGQIGAVACTQGDLEQYIASQG